MDLKPCPHSERDALLATLVAGLEEIQEADNG